MQLHGYYSDGYDNCGCLPVNAAADCRVGYSWKWFQTARDEANMQLFLPIMLFSYAQIFHPLAWFFVFLDIFIILNIAGV